MVHARVRAPFLHLPLSSLVLVANRHRSPRWLVKIGHEKQARFILGRLRGEDTDDAEREFQEIRSLAEVEAKNTHQTSYYSMLFGVGTGKLHTARRVQLVIWLQILQEWIGIAGITIYGPEIFTIAGIKAKDRQWVSGLNDITYMVCRSSFFSSPM